MSKKVVVIGAGYSGLASATCLAKEGYEVELLEKHDQCGGRSRMFKTDGFSFDMGPSWYWMPDVFDKYFELFGKSVGEYYELKRLDPGYRVYFGENDFVDVPAEEEDIYKLFESIEPGAGQKLKEFLDDAAYKYEVGINDLVYKPSTSIMEFANAKVLGGMTKMKLFSSFAKFARKYFKDPRLLQIVEFPVLFLGAKPDKIPALYSLMNYADLKLGTWYPMGGMHQIVEGMRKLAEEIGVKISLGEDVQSIESENGKVTKVVTQNREVEADIVVGGADYHHIEKQLLPDKQRNYSDKYWENRVMAPSCLLFYCGVNKRLKNLQHHNLFFDQDFDEHAREIYDSPQWPSKPLFYASAPSLTDNSVAPDGMENLFLLIPIAPGLADDDEERREQYFDLLMDRLEKITGQSIRDHIVYKRSYCYSNFVEDYNAFKGNAYGLANTLKQTAILKPSLRNKKIDNLYYTGQLTVPGPGVPPSLISGQVVAREITKTHPL